MDDITTDTPKPAPRRNTFMIRWVVCTVLVAGVFLASRLTIDTHERPDATDTLTPTEPSTEDPSAAPSSPDDETEDGSGSVDVFAAFDGLVDELFGPSDPDETRVSGDDSGIEPANWNTASGDGAAGGAWSISYPTDWQLDETNPGVAMFSAPDYPNLATVVTRPYTGPLDAEADRDLAQIMQGMPDGVLVSVENLDFDGHEAIRAELGYTNPAGQLAAVNIVWIRDSGTLYLIAGEAGVDQPELQAAVDQALNSFTITTLA